MADQILRDGVMIPLPEPAERTAFAKWLVDNKVNEPFHPDHHYDNVSAFRAGIGRAPGEEGHFPDTFKLPGHDTFSNESQYATGDNAKYAGSWNGDQYTPSAQRYQGSDNTLSRAVLSLLNSISSSSFSKGVK
jgi:hypothetical protein